MPGFSPSSSHASGSGTVTPPVTLIGTTNAIELDIVGAAGQTATLLRVSEDGSTADPLLSVGYSTGKGFLVQHDPVNSKFNGFATNGNQALVYDEAGVAAISVDSTMVGFSSANGAKVIPSGYYVVFNHAAPADAALDVGECALWFDQTNGAAKLMMKAKQADGTVKTGSVNVQT